MSVGGPQTPISEHRECNCGAAAAGLHSAYCELAVTAYPESIFNTDQRLIPVQRTEHDIQLTQQALLEDILRELQRANSTAREGAVSSILIEDNPTKDRAVRVTSKVYAGSALPVEEAIEAHGRAHRLAEQQALNGWAETLQAEQAKREGAG